MDGYVNMLNRLGTSLDNSRAYEYEPEPWTPDVSLANHYETNGLFAKIIDTPAEEAVKHGFNLTLNNPDYEQYIEDTLDILDWEAKAATAIKWARLFGGAIIVMLIDDVDLCQYFGHKKLKVYADFFNSSSSFCWGVI